MTDDEYGCLCGSTVSRRGRPLPAIYIPNYLTFLRPLAGDRVLNGTSTLSGAIMDG